MKTGNIDLMMATLGPRFRKRRKDLGLPQKQLATSIDISNTFLSDIEHGRAVPSLETYLKLCKALSLEISFIQEIDF